MNPSKAWNTKLEAASFFLPSKNLYYQCAGVKFLWKFVLFEVALRLALRLFQILEIEICMYDFH